jgi:hypothetical protein
MAHMSISDCDKEGGIMLAIKEAVQKISWFFIRRYCWIIKVCQYAVVLWKDYDWDYSCFLRLTQYKLRRMREQISRDNITVSSEQVAAQIKHAEALIEKYLTDDFGRKEYEEHLKKWGKRELNFESHKLEISVENATTEELKLQEKKEYMAAYSKSDTERVQCLDDIFSHIRKHIEEWWN